MSFTYQVKYLHKMLAPKVPIGVFVEALQPQAIGLADKTQFYAPERFSVQICGSIGSAGGAIRLDVPVHANPQWLDTMKQRFANMIGLPSSSSIEDMDFRTVTGRSISTVPVEQLRTLGKLNFFVEGKMIRLPSMPEIPIEYSLTKVKNLQSWVQEATAELPELIAAELLGKNVVEINAAIRMDGPLHKMIEDHIRGDSQENWNEFVRVHHMNAPATMTEREAERALGLVSRQILIGFRDFVAAAKEPIGVYVASVEARRLERDLKDRGEDAQHYAPLVGDSVADKKEATKTKGFDLFKKLAEDMLSTPVLQRSIVETLYNRALPLEDCQWYHYGKNRELRRDDHGKIPKGQYDSSKPQKKKKQQQQKAAPLVVQPRPPQQQPTPTAPQQQPQATPTPQQKQSTGDGNTEGDDSSKGSSVAVEDMEARVAALKASGARGEIQKFIAANVRKITLQQLSTLTATSDTALDKLKVGELDILIGRLFSVPPTASNAAKKRDAILTLIRDERAAGRIQAHHPWNAQIHHTLEPTAGAYPSYYTLLNKKQDMSKDAPYSGDIKQTYEAYHLFAGVPPSPVGLVIDPIACKHNKKRSDSESESDDEQQQPVVASRAPPVILTAAAAAANIPPRPPMKRFAPPVVSGIVERVKARMVPYVEVGDAAPQSIDDDYVDDDYGLPLSSDAFQ